MSSSVSDNLLVCDKVACPYFEPLFDRFFSLEGFHGNRVKQTESFQADA
jgi:hypothetical protein